ncbi:MAG: hypothetical protein AAGI52_12000 [Bacteroidota bacterium]
MARFRPAVALVLLAALASGGIVAPLLHEAMHAQEEWADHDHEEHHGTADHAEGLPLYSESSDEHGPCALCATTTVTVTGQTATLHSLDTASEDYPSAPTHVDSRTDLPHSARGPPVLV